MSRLGTLRSILAPNPSPMTLDGTRSVIVGRARPVVIDPGPADDAHLARLLEALDGFSPIAILLTHHHPDHSAAAPVLAAATGAPIVMADGALDVGFPAVPIDRTIGEGDVFETDAGPVRALATPGHVPEHLAFFWYSGEAPPGGVLFVGDLLMGEGDTSLVALPEGDLGLYIRSLRRVAELAPGLLFPAHGPPLLDPPDAIDRYLRHRRHRLEQLLDALRRTGRARPAELVSRVYGGDLDPRLRGAAEASLRAMLDYLRAEGSIRLDDDEVRPAGDAKSAEEIPHS